MSNTSYLVVAPKGCVCPKERSRERITNAEPISVPDTPYYRARIAEGSLLEVIKEKKTLPPSKRSKA
jgi:hypothetical protein